MLLNKDILKCILDVFVLRMGYELSHIPKEHSSGNKVFVKVATPSYDVTDYVFVATCVV